MNFRCYEAKTEESEKAGSDVCVISAKPVLWTGLQTDFLKLYIPSYRLIWSSV